MSGNRTIVTRLRAEMSQFKKEWNSASKAVEDAEKKIKRSSTALGNLASDVDNNARAWDVAGKSMLVSGLAMATAIGFSIKAAIEWESAWAGVLKTTNGTPAQLRKLEDGLRSLATQLPASASEIAGVAEAAGALGVARDDVLSFTRTMIDLGETTNLTADEAATSIAQIANVMKTAPEDIDNFGAALVALGNDGASTEKQILEMAQRIAGAGAIIGLSESDVLGISNALASVGIEAEAGGSSVSRILIDISKAVSTNSTDLAKWAEVSGMSIEDFSNTWKTSPAEGFEAFTSGLGKVNAAGGDVFTTLEELGQTDVRTTQALLSMATSGDMLAQSLKGGTEAWEENTALAAEAEKRYATTAAQIEVAKNKVNESLISIGAGMLPAVNRVLDGFGEIVDMFNYLPAPLKTATGVAGGLGAAFATAGGLAILAVPKILAFTDAVRAMKPGPIKTMGSSLMGFGRLLLGPVGIGLAAVTIGLGIWAKKNADAKQAQAQLAAQAEAFTATLDKQTGAITEATKQQAIDNLAREGALTFAKKYGISQGLVTEAALGSKDALAALTEEMKRKDVDIWENKDVIGKIFGAANAAEKGKKDFKAAAEATQQLRAEQVKAGLSSRGLSERLQELSVDPEEARKKLDELKESTREVALSFVDFSKDVDKKSMSFAKWIKGLNEMADAQTRWQSNMILAKTMGATEEAIAKFQELGPAGAKMLDEMVKGGDKSVAQLNEIFDGGIPSADEFSRIMNEIPADILVQFDIKGDKDAIRKAADVANTYGILPPDVETILMANDWATEDIQAVLTRMAKLSKAKAEPRIDAKGNALSIIGQVRAEMVALSLMGAATMAINVVKKVTNAKGGFTGMRVPDGYAGGGKVPGTPPSDPRRDNVLAMTQHGNPLLVRSREWIINERQSEKNDKWLAAINGGLNLDDLFGSMRGFASGGRASALELKNQQRTIRDIERSLAEREKFGKKPKKGKDTRPTRLVLRGLDRQIALLELAEAKRELRDLKTGAEARREAAEERADELAKARQDRIDTATGTRDSVASSIAGGFGLSQFTGKNQFGFYGAISGSSIAAGAAAFAAKVKSFAVKIEQARKMGIPPAMLQEIGGLGVEEGTQALDALLSASSGDIATIQSAYRDIDTYAKGAGEVIAKALDLATAGQDSAAGYAAGFIEGLNSYAAAMQAAAANATQGVKSQVPKTKTKTKTKGKTVYGKWKDNTPKPSGDFGPTNSWAASYEYQATAAMAAAAPVAVSIDYNELAAALDSRPQEVNVNANLMLGRRQAGTIVQVGTAVVERQG